MDGARDVISSPSQDELEDSTQRSTSSGSQADFAVPPSGIKGDEQPCGWMMPLMGRNAWFQDAAAKALEAVGKRQVDGLVCLGMGSPSRSKEARYKYACALTLSKVFGVAAEDVMVYDAAMYKEDVAAMCKRGWEMMRHKFDMHFVGDGVVVVFMPHNDAVVLQNVVDFLKDIGALGRAVIFGDALPKGITLHQGKLSTWFLDLTNSPDVNTRPCLDSNLSLHEHAFKDLAITTFIRRSYSEVVTSRTLETNKH